MGVGRVFGPGLDRMLVGRVERIARIRKGTIFQLSLTAVSGLNYTLKKTTRSKKNLLKIKKHTHRILSESQQSKLVKYFSK